MNNYTQQNVDRAIKLAIKECNIGVLCSFSFTVDDECVSCPYFQVIGPCCGINYYCSSDTELLSSLKNLIGYTIGRDDQDGLQDYNPETDDTIKD